jgi:hypothetical protein
VSDDDPVFHLGDAWCRPRHTFGFMTLKPGAHGATQDHFAAIGLDSNADGIDLGVA